jgi:ABC-type lipoprotein export system ATPase subunit
MLMVTHDTQVASIATRRLYLDRGKFLEANEVEVLRD